MWELSLGDMEGATPSTDGGWYVAGTPETNREGTYSPQLMKLDGNGEVVWTKDFPETHGLFTDVVVHDDGLWVSGWDQRTDDGSLDPSNPWPAGAGYLSRHSLDGELTDVVPLSPRPHVFDLEVRGDALYFTAEGTYIQTDEGDIAGDGETTNVLTVKLTLLP